MVQVDDVKIGPGTTQMCNLTESRMVHMNPKAEITTKLNLTESGSQGSTRPDYYKTRITKTWPTGPNQPGNT